MTDQEYSRRFVDRAIRWRMIQLELSNPAELAVTYGIHPNTIRNIKNRPSNPQRLIIDAMIAYCTALRNGDVANGALPEHPGD